MTDGRWLHLESGDRLHSEKQQGSWRAVLYDPDGMKVGEATGQTRAYAEALAMEDAMPRSGGWWDTPGAG